MQILTSTKENSPTIETLCSRFRAQSAFYARFHIAFLSFLAIQVLSFSLFFSQLNKSLLGAVAISLFFLTLFSYLVLVFFFQTKKITQFTNLQRGIQEIYELQFPSNPLKLAESLQQLTTTLSDQESVFYLIPCPFTSLTPLITKVKIKLHWKNFHTMQELLLLAAIENLFTLVKERPCDPQVHEALANLYLHLSTLYLPKKWPWVPSVYFNPDMKQHFLSCSQRAIEELHIILDLGEPSPWAYMKLAEIYRLRESPDEEIAQHEQLLAYTTDEESLFRLGILYFQQGHTAKGLKIYNRLKEASFPKLQQLLSYYDTPPFSE